MSLYGQSYQSYYKHQQGDTMVAIPKSVEIPVVYKIDNITGDPVFDTQTMMRELEARITQFKNKYKYSPNPRLGDMDVWNEFVQLNNIRPLKSK